MIVNGAERGAIRGLPAWVVGEFVGTFLLVFFGCGSVCAAAARAGRCGCTGAGARCAPLAVVVVMASFVCRPG